MSEPITKLPAIPALATVDRALRPVLSAIKETIEVQTGKRGNPLDRVLTLRDALDSGIASSIRIGGRTYYGSGGSGIVPGYQQTDYAVPPQIEGLRAAGALQTILLDWEPQNYASFSYVEVWRAAVDDLGAAVKIGQTPAFMYSDEVGPGAVRYYWVRAVNKKGVTGSFNGTAGTRGETALDPTYALELLTGQITESHLYGALNARINLIDSPIVGLVDRAIEHEQQTESAAEAVIRSLLTQSAEIDSARRVGARVTVAEQTITTLTSDLAAEASARLVLAAQVDANAAAIVVEQTARAEADHAEAVMREALAVRVGDAEAAITSEAGVRASADAAEATARQALATQLRGSYTGTDVALVTSGLIYEERTARSAADAAEASSRATLATQMRGSYTGTDITLVTSGLIYEERQARSTADAAEASARTTLAAQLRGSYTGTDVTAVTEGLVYQERVARAAADSANATSISQVQARLDTGDYAAVKVQSQASADELDGVLAQYTIKLEVNGRVSGVGLMNSGTTSEFIVVADKFGIVTPAAPGGTPVVPFVIGTVGGVSGVVTIANALIQDAAITSAKIGAAAIQTAHIQDAAINGAKIASATITDAHITALAASKITAGTISVAVELTSATVTGGLIRTSSNMSGKNVLINEGGHNAIRVYNSANQLVGYIGSGEDPYFTTRFASFGRYDAGEGKMGLAASSGSNYGVYALSVSGDGVHGASTSGRGVWGFSTSNSGVLGGSTDGPGVQCSSTNQSALNLVPRSSFPSSPNVGDVICYDAGAANDNNGMWAYVRNRGNASLAWRRVANE